MITVSYGPCEKGVFGDFVRLLHDGETIKWVYTDSPLWLEVNTCCGKELDAHSVSVPSDRGSEIDMVGSYTPQDDIRQGILQGVFDSL